MIRTKRAFDKPLPEDGFRILVDRLWPRGLSKEAAKMDIWMKEIAPSTELRKWFGHDPEKWEEFVRRYFLELDASQEAVSKLAELVKSKNALTFVHAASDIRHNNAVALRQYLESALGFLQRTGAQTQDAV